MIHFPGFARLLTVLVALLLSGQHLLGVGAYPFPQEIMQPDGTRLTIRLHGDEWFNWTATSDGYRIVRNQLGVFEYASVLKSGEVVPSGIKVSDVAYRKPEEIAFLQSVSKGPGLDAEAIRLIRLEKKGGLLKSGTASSYFPTKGAQKLLVILANFSDTSPAYSQTNFNSYMNEAGYNGTGSFKDYYLENSRNQLEVTSVVTEWVTVPQGHDYYGPDAKWGEFAFDAVTAAYNQGVDFSQFDNDGDGIVEGVAIIHQGPGQEVTGNENDIWSHSWTLASAGYSLSARTFNGVVVNQYTTQPELRNASGAMNTIGVICHEFGHNLGAPDFYDTDEDENGQYDGTGRWDLMAGGSYNGVPSGARPAHHNPYTKILYDWTSATEISVPGALSLEPVISTGQIYRINSPVDGEYLLLENRQQTGFDTNLPGAGLLVYHADGNWINTHMDSNDINTTSHQGFYPLAAGGVINSSSCPFPGSENNTELTDGSDPAMKTWSGEGFNRSVTSIVLDGSVIRFDYMGMQNGSPLSIEVIEDSHASLQVNWTPATEGYPVLLAWSADGVFGAPTDGTVYEAGNAIPGGGEVLYYGTLTGYLHEGLEAATQYHYSVWSNVTDTWSLPLKANGVTLAMPVTVFPWFEGFETGLNNWEHEVVSGDYFWDIKTTGAYNKPWSAFEGSNFASFFAATLTQPVARIISPSLVLDPLKSYALEFRHYQAKYDWDVDQLRVLIKRETATEWEEMAVYAGNEEEWIHQYIDIPYSETVQIAFEGLSNWGYGIGVDSVVVKEVSGCTPPASSVTSVTATEISLSGLTLGWSQTDGDGVLVVARKNGKVLDLPVSGVTYAASSVFGSGDAFGSDAYVVYAGNSNSVSLSNLEHSSDYHFAFFAYNTLGMCYRMVPDRFVSSTEVKIHTITVSVTDGLNPVNLANVKLDGVLQLTDASGIAQYEVTHSTQVVALSVACPGKETVWRKVVADDSKQVDIVLNAVDPIAPSVISQTNDYKDVTLSWNPVIDENFDNYESFALSIPGWTFEDKDQSQTYGFEGVDFPNTGYTGSFITMDPFSDYLLQAGSRFDQYSGRQFLGCVAATTPPNNDWLISPVFTVKEGDYLSLMAKSYTNQYGLEKFNVLVAMQEPSPQPYVNISGGVQEAPVIWTPFSYSLADYVGKKIRFAIQCVSHDAFLLMLDLIQVKPQSPSGAASLVKAEPLQSVAKTKNYQGGSYAPKPVSPQRRIEGIPEVGPIGYTVMLDGVVLENLNGFTQTRVTAAVTKCAGNLFSVKTNYLVEGASSGWTDYTAYACYSVTFKVKDAHLIPISGASVTFDGVTQQTNAEGVASFHGYEPAVGLAYNITMENYEAFSGSLDIIDADLNVNVTMTSTSVNELNGATLYLYPNPTRNEVTVSGIVPGKVHFQLYDLGGRLVRSRMHEGGSDLRVILDGLAPGVYLVLLKQEDDVWRQKLVVTE